jgi:hypothetical protein
VLGPDARPVGELVQQLTRAGLELGTHAQDRVTGALDADSRFAELDDDRWIFVSSMLEGTKWVTPIPATLPAEDCLPAEPDLTLLAWWALEQPIEIGGDAGGALECVELDDGRDALLGPPGWLAPYSDAAMLVEVVDDRVFLHGLDAVPDPTSAQAAGVRSAFERVAQHDVLSSGLLDEPAIELVRAPLEDLLWEAVGADRDAFVGEPIPPVDELLAASGLERRGDVVASAGMDWGVLERWQRRRKLGSIHQLSDEQVDAAEILLGASYAVIDGTPQPLGPAEDETRAAALLAICLADAAVARAFLGEHTERGTDPELLVRFARLLLDHVDDGTAVGAHWLLARSLDHLGDPLGAQAALELAVTSDVDFPPARSALASFLSDRGDAPAAFALLRDLELDDDDALLLEVAPYALQRPRPSAGRNDLCPCGSGRKYKVCHLGRERLPLIDRGPWLYAKARRYLHDDRFRVLRAEIASTIAEDSGRPGLMLKLLDSQLVDDVALCEGGVYDAFVAERDAILPDDEALLAARWALVPRSLFEIERVEDDNLMLRDLRTGDHLMVTNTSANNETRPGWLMVGRPLPIDDTWRAFSGFVRIPDSLRDEVLDALDGDDPFEVAAVIGRSFAPPQMQNTDGEPLRFHELRYRVADRERAAAALAVSELHDEGDGQFTLVRDSLNQADTVIMSLELSGDELQISVNSDRRAHEAQALVAELLPDAVLVDDDERELEEMLDDARTEPPEPSATLSPEDPEVAAVLDEFVQERERRWIDEPVPALGGMTPREASHDPIGFHALERLLRDFEDRPLGPGGFNVDRIRSLLDLR